MSNTKYLSIQDTYLFIERYPKIVHWKKDNLISVSTQNKLQLFPDSIRSIRLFFGDKFRSKTIQAACIKQATVLNVHPIYVQRIYDAYSSSKIEMTDQFVAEKLKSNMFKK